MIIGETGWASDGLTKGDAEPSLTNLARYFLESSAWAEDNNVPTFYFSAFDENWKELPPAGPTPFLTENHWGIWDSGGVLKRTLIPEPVLCKTFDEPFVNPMYAENQWESNAPEPNIVAGDPDSDSYFLRLLYDGNGLTHYSYVAFDRIAVGLYPRIEAEFDFRLYGPDDQNDADGFAFMLIPTLLNDVNGPSNYGHHAGFFAEEPKLPKVFAIGFEVYDWPADRPCDKVYVSWDGKWFPDPKNGIDVSDKIDLDSGVFHRAKIELRADDSNSLVTFIIDPNVYDPNGGAPYVVVQDLRIEGLRPYENRAEFIGRSGWHNRDINVDIDNIKVTYKPQICDCFLPADLNRDCQVDFKDFAVLANDWLQTCNSSDSNEDECFPTSHPDYANWVTVGRPDCWCCLTQCHGDANCDGTVDDRDLPPEQVPYPDPMYDPCFDFDHNLYITIHDIALVLLLYGTSPPADCLAIP